MITVFTQAGTRYREERHPAAWAKKWEWQYHWVRDRRQLIHKGRKP